VRALSEGEGTAKRQDPAPDKGDYQHGASALTMVEAHSSTRLTRRPSSEQSSGDVRGAVVLHWADRCVRELHAETMQAQAGLFGHRDELFLFEFGIDRGRPTS